MGLIKKQIAEFEAIRKKRKKGECKFMQNIVDSVVDEEIKVQNNLLTVKNSN